MILPTKGISPERALITVGAEVIEMLDEPATPSAVWEKYRARLRRRKSSKVIAYDWFILSLDLLFILGVVELDDAGRLVRVSVS